MFLVVHIEYVIVYFLFPILKLRVAIDWKELKTRGWLYAIKISCVNCFDNLNYSLYFLEYYLLNHQKHIMENNGWSIGLFIHHLPILSSLGIVYPIHWSSLLSFWDIAYANHCFYIGLLSVCFSFGLWNLALVWLVVILFKILIFSMTLKTVSIDHDQF
jgi:hypothetical protein